MRKFLQAFLFLISTIATTVAFGQGEITFSEITGGVSSSPVTAGDQDIAIFGIQVDKAGGATSSISSITINLSSDPAGKFTNPRLFVSTNDIYGPADTEVGGLTISTLPSSFSFSGTITSFGGGAGASTRYYFIVVDVDPAVDGTTPSIEPSISEVDITAGTTVNANTINGTTYTFTAITPNITGVGPGSSTCEGETITITGTGFSSPSVTINGVTATITSGPSSTSIDITAPGSSAIGTHQITVENSNGNLDNSSNYTINPPVDFGLSVTASNSNPASGVNFTINIANTQSSVDYRIRRVAPLPMGMFTSAQTGNGGTRTFGPFNHATPGVYTYRAYATSTNCGSEQPLTQDVIITVAALTANAGGDETICSGEIITLGGTPTAQGGTGFYNITWTSDQGFTSTDTNPTDNPNVTTVYTLSIEDSNGDIETDTKTVNVKESTPPSELDITLLPDSVAYNKNGTTGIALDFGLSGTTNHLTHTFSGDGVVSSQSKFYPNFANVGENTVSMVFTNSDNCDTEITRTVNVYDPEEFVTGLDPFYCPEGTDNFMVVVPSVITYPPPFNYVSFVDITLKDKSGQLVAEGPLWSHSGQNVQIAPGLLQPGNYIFEIQYLRNTVVAYIDGCPEQYICGFNLFPPSIIYCTRYNCKIPQYAPRLTTSKVRLTILKPPVTNIEIDKIDYCRDAAPAKLTGSPIGGIWTGLGITPNANNDALPSYSVGEDGVAFFNPSVANPGLNLVRYIYQDNSGCKDTTEININVFDIPSVDFSVGNGCVGIPLPFSPTISTPPGVNIKNYVWDFNDEFDADTVSILNDPTYHSYSSSQTYSVKLQANTLDGCQVTRAKDVAIGDIPDIDLSWRNVCEDQNTQIEITSNFFQNTINLVDQLDWDYGDGNTFMKNTPFTLADKIVSHAYAATDYYTARATITSNLGCSNYDTVSVYKVPTIGPVQSKTYEEKFNGALFETHGWKTGGTNSSWEWGVPSGAISAIDGAAFVTNLTDAYNANEKSWVHSPCFDLSAIDRPVLSFDFRSLTREQLDGAVLQMNTSNLTNDESQWVNVGVIGEGKNWFNQSGIFANPGNQTILQSGWSGKDEGNWKEAIFALDDNLELVDPSHVRFRFAFASLTSSSANPFGVGFAFDNVKISERDRLVLLETFTNAGGNNTGTEPNKVANQAINSNFVSENELVKIEYHIGIGGPGIDSLYLQNRQDANARAAYYGITATPFAFLDARNGNLNTLFDEQKLASAKASIDTIITDASIGESIQVNFTPKINLPPNTILRVVVVEKIIPYSAPNGEVSFTYVMKQMLPNATGIKYDNGLVANTPVTETIPWPAPSKIYNPNELAIIAFLQNDSTFEIYQAKILSTLNYNPYPNVNLITALEPDFINQIRVFPSPANEALTIQLPASLPQSIPVKLYDTYGREVYHSSFETGDHSKIINTRNMATGIYILQLDSSDGPLLRKKVLIGH